MGLPINQIICGDCLDIMKDWPDDCVALVLTDPPYGVGLGDKPSVINKGKYDSFVDSQEFVEEIILPRIRHCFFKTSRVVVTPGVRNMFLYPSPDSVGCVYCSAGAGLNRWGFTCSHPILYYGKDPQKGSYPNSFASNERSENFSHPCPKPLGWMLWLVNRASLAGELIIDPFCGSGTTCVAAKMLGRNYIGIDISPDYCKIARARLEAVDTGVPAKESQAGQMALFKKGG